MDSRIRPRAAWISESVIILVPEGLVILNDEEEFAYGQAVASEGERVT